MAPYSNAPQKLICAGVGLNSPPNLLKPGKFPALINARSKRMGSIESRNGYRNLYGAPLTDANVHTLRDINNYLPGASNAFALAIGAGTNLYTTPNGILEGQPVLQDSGYSGQPLTTVQFRPEQSPESWLYIADALRMRKIKADGTNYGVGVVPPNNVPVADISDSLFDQIGNFNSDSQWTATYPVASPFPIVPHVVQRNPSGTVMTRVLYDNGTGPGLCSIVPQNSFEAYEWIGTNGTVLLNNTETALCFATHPPGGTTEIAAIEYDSGSDGPCSIVFTISLENVDRDTIIRLANASEYVRVESKSITADGAYSIRTSTAVTHAAGEAVVIVPSIRTKTNGIYTAGQSISSNAIAIEFGTIGEYTLNAIFTPPLDLSKIGTRATRLNDFIHFTIRTQDPTVFGSCKLKILCTSNDSTAGIYTYEFSTADINTLRRQQWVDFNIPLSAFTYVGNAITNDLSSVWGAEFNLTMPLVGDTSFEVTSLLIHGGYDSDVPPASINGYSYRFRYRSSFTGAKSIQSPATRYQLRPQRQPIIIAVTPSSDPQIDQIDIERFGGTTSTWNYIGSVANVAGVSFFDNFSDLTIQGNAALEVDVFQPFPVQDTPRKGTCNAVGTLVTNSGGDLFNTRWAPGDTILINGVANVLYGSPQDTTHLQLVESAGVLLGVTWYIASPTLMGEPLQFIWGPLGGEGAAYSFAVGDKYNPGTVHIFKGNDMDASPDTFTIEVTSPSEPLMNGVLYDTQSFVFSSERLFALRPTPSGPNLFVPLETPLNRGLKYRWALCVGGGFIWLLSDDGIYKTTTTNWQNITDTDLYPLFPHDQSTPAPVIIGDVTFYPPDLTNEEALRLNYYNGWVQFSYVDIAGNNRTLCYHVETDSWWPDIYSDPLQLFYTIEGKNNYENHLLAASNTGIVAEFGDAIETDNGQSIPTTVMVPCFDAGETRAQKVWGDYILDGLFQDQIQSRLWFDSYTVPSTINTVPSLPLPAAETQVIVDLSDGDGFLYRNVALGFTWSSLRTIRLFEWIPSFLVKPSSSILRVSDWDDAGFQGRKYVRGVKLWADTYDQTRQVNVEVNGGIIAASLTSVRHNGEQLIPYAFPTPFTAELIRLSPVDPNTWRLWQPIWVYDKYPELISLITGWTNGGYPGAKWVQGIRLCADTGGLDVQLQIQYDGGQTGPLLTVNHNGKQTLPYSWPGFIAHDLRFVPATACGIFEEETQWVFEPEPDLASYWDTQPTTHDLIGWQTPHDGYLAYISTQPINLVITPNNGPVITVVMPAQPIYSKTYFLLPPMKATSFQYQVNDNATGTGLRLFMRDCELRVKSWGDQGSFQSKNPFGDITRLRGAII